MKKAYAIGVIGLAVLILVAIDLSCVFLEENGSISGTVFWQSRERPCPIWPPDTCLYVTLSSYNKSMLALRPIWPPDTCSFKFEHVPYGQYSVALMRFRPGMPVSKALRGEYEVIKFYTNLIDSVLMDSLYASIIEINKGNPNVKSVDIVVR